jgi:hypothetical protein
MTDAKSCFKSDCNFNKSIDKEAGFACVAAGLSVTKQAGFGLKTFVARDPVFG